MVTFHGGCEQGGAHGIHNEWAMPMPMRSWMELKRDWREGRCHRIEVDTDFLKSGHEFSCSRIQIRMLFVFAPALFEIKCRSRRAKAFQRARISIDQYLDWNTSDDEHYPHFVQQPYCWTLLSPVYGRDDKCCQFQW